MGLLAENTKWILFLSSSNEPEDRHIRDLAFGLFNLEKAGAAHENISIYIDGNNKSNISKILHSGTPLQYEIRSSGDFFEDLKQNEHDNIVMFVTGHGGIEGIDAPNPIKPSPLISSIRSAPNLKKSVIYLGQCVAGIFNYIGAGSKISKSPGADVIIIGATNLHSSISSATTETIHSGETPWIANLFLLHVFKWIYCPIDIDGDGKMTVMDSYKYAGAMSNNANKDIKIGSFIRSKRLHEEWLEAHEEFQADPSPQKGMNFQAAEDLYLSSLAIRYTHQECWILNAIPAQSLEF